MIDHRDEIKSRINAHSILRLIGYEKSSPSASGKEIRDFCPIHRGDRQRSLSIGEHGSWTCHSCGAKGGDLVALYQQALKIDFLQAVQNLADYLGIAIPKVSSNASKGASDEEKLGKSRSIAADAWIHASDIGSHSYFDKKGIQPPPGIRYGKDEKGNSAVIIPYRDVAGVIQTVQFISEFGKFFAKGTTKEGAFFTLGSLDGAKTVYLCEGVATAVSIWESQNKAIPVLSCADAGNLPAVAKAIRKKHSQSEIIVAMDSDAAGGKAATLVIESVQNASLRRPAFDGLTDDGKGAKDFDDLRRLAGYDALRKQLSIPYAIPVLPKPKILDLKPIKLLSPTYFSEAPPEKEQLLYWTDDQGRKKTFLHKGVVALLVAEGGAGKTHLLVQLAASVATGIPFLTHFEIKTPGSVCIIVGENDEMDLRRLFWKIHKHFEKLLHENSIRKDGKNFGLHYEQPLGKLLDRIYPFSMHGMDASFLNKNGEPTEFYNSLFTQLQEREPPEGWQFIILDPCSRFAGLESEKDNAVATKFIALTERVSLSLKGKPTVILSHHKSKAATTSKEDSGQTAGRGSSAFTDGCRWQANLDSKDKENGTSLFYVSKTNFTAYPPKFTIRKDFEGVSVFAGWELKK